MTDFLLFMHQFSVVTTYNYWLADDKVSADDYMNFSGSFEFDGHMWYKASGAFRMWKYPDTWDSWRISPQSSFPASMTYYLVSAN